ncbi:MAG: hypothetical protein GC152_13165 [Alphaproteobacteria bacterium]|nr:hypothetical protein [Alphaproteobacteria bacterium]
MWPRSVGCLAILTATAALAGLAAQRAIAVDETDGAACEVPGRTLIAVVGDSDSHAYRDRINGIRRGGAYHQVTFNWLEIWRRLRPGEIDPGQFRVSGAPETIARAMAAVGAPTRTPAKEDFSYNYALSGADCASLFDAWPRQGAQLVARITAAPAEWRNGIVIIRIGINDLGQARHLLHWLEDPGAGVDRAEACLNAVDRAVSAIRGVAGTRIALIGVARETDAPIDSLESLSSAERARAEAPLDLFDRGLAQIATDRDGVAYVDGRSWFARRFATTETPGASANIAGMRVLNERSDRPDHLHLEDNHAGTVAGGLFLQSLVDELNRQLGCGFEPIGDEEIADLIRSALRSP